MAKWTDPSIEAMLSAENIVNEILAGIEYYKSNIAYMDNHPNDWGPTNIGSESAVSALRHITVYAEILRQQMQPLWLGFEPEDVARTAEKINS